jgi:hypothetical protein
MDIGSVELAVVSEIEQRENADVDELKDAFKIIDSTAVKHESGVDRIFIRGFVNEEVHSSNLSLEKQKENLKRLRTNSPSDNSIDYKDYKGYLLIDTVDFTENADSRIVDDVEIIARYFPWPKYFENSEP